MPICNHPIFLLRAFAIMPFEPNLECKSHHSQSLMCAKDTTKTGPAVSNQMEHRSTFVRFALTIVNEPHTTARSMNKRTSINGHFSFIRVHQQIPPKLWVTFLIHSMRSSLTMLSRPCLLLQPQTHLNTLFILKTIHPFLQTWILRIMPTRPHLSLASIGVYMQLVKILNFRSRLSKRLLRM